MGSELSSDIRRVGAYHQGFSPRYPIAFDYDNQDHPHGFNCMEGGSGGGDILGLTKSSPLLLDDRQLYGTGKNPYGQMSMNEEAQFQDNLKKAIIQQAL